MWVCVFDVNAPENTHFALILMDQRGILLHDSGLSRGGEGESGKINKTSLGFVLLLFQNKQSCGRERELRGGGGGDSLRREKKKVPCAHRHSNRRGAVQVRVNR